MRISSKKIHLIIIILITSLVYLNTFQNQFVWDDKDFILGWEETRTLKNMPIFLKGAVPLGHEGVHRPLRGVYYALSYQLWGTNPVGYHFQALLVHLICTILVYLITLQITKKSIIAFMTSLLFGIHPIHTNAITFVTSSFDQIGIVLFLASCYLYLKSTRDLKLNKLSYTFSVIFAIFAFFSYELTLTLPLVLLLFDFYFRIVKKEDRIKKIKIYSPYFLSAGIYVFIRFFILDMIARGQYLCGSFYITMLAMSKAFIKEILLVIVPIKLTIYHTISKGIYAYSNSELSKELICSQSIFNLNILFSIIVILTLLVLIVKLYKNHKIFSFCIAWFFVTLLPVSNIIPIQTLLDEDFLYLPSFAFCLGFSFLIYYFYRQFSEKDKMKYAKNGLMIFFILTILFYSSLTISRNTDWKDELSLWSKTAEYTPGSALAHNNLGLAYVGKDRIDLAVQEYEKALEINPGYSRANNNLGLIYLGQGEIDLAIEEFKKAIESSPAFAKAYNNLGNVYSQKNELDLAVEQYKMALIINPYYSKAHNNLAIIYTKQNKIDLAIQEYQKTISLKPSHYKAHSNLGLLYGMKGNIDLAIAEQKKALTINPNYAKAHYNLGIFYEQQGKLDLAAAHFKKALAIDPDYTKAQNKLAAINKNN